VRALLESRTLAGSFVPGSPIYAKRQDGSTIPISVDAAEGIAHLEYRIHKQEVREYIQCTAQEISSLLLPSNPIHLLVPFRCMGCSIFELPQCCTATAGQPPTPCDLLALGCWGCLEGWQHMEQLGWF
jgi:hypothetical protein